MDEVPGRRALSSGLLAELPESEASGSAREIYAEIRRLCGVPMVALIYRHLATIPGALEWSWALLRPAMAVGLIQEQAWQLAARATVAVDRSLPREALRVAGISADDETRITDILEAYNRANPINILAVRCLAHHLQGQLADSRGAGDPATAAATGLSLPGSWEVPPAPAPLPAMIKPQDMTAEVNDLVWLLTNRGRSPGSGLLPSMYRHLARWPNMLGFAASIVTAQFAAIDAASGRFRQEASDAARELAGRMIRPSGIEPPIAQAREQLQTALSDFSLLIPEMVAIGGLLRRAMPTGLRVVSGRAPPEGGIASGRTSPGRGVGSGHTTQSRAAQAVVGNPERLSAEDALKTRRSVRAFLPREVPRETVDGLLALASRSASGSNIQPWKVHVIAGSVRSELSRTILDAIARDGYDKYRREWNYYPVNWREPFLGRRRKIGWDLYGLLGIRKGDFEGTERQRRRNYEFFGAPVGMIFTLDDDLEIGSWLDLGIYIGSLTVAARGRGLDTCPQAAFADFHTLIRPLLGLPEREIIICGLALGYVDPEATENALVTERAPVVQFASFAGFP